MFSDSNYNAQIQLYIDEAVADAEVQQAKMELIDAADVVCIRQLYIIDEAIYGYGPEVTQLRIELHDANDGGALRRQAERAVQDGDPHSWLWCFESHHRWKVILDNIGALHILGWIPQCAIHAYEMDGYNAAGYLMQIVDDWITPNQLLDAGEDIPDRPALYRGLCGCADCYNSGWEIGLSWTGSKLVAESFAALHTSRHGHPTGILLSMPMPAPEQILFYTNGRTEDEFVLHPDYFDSMSASARQSEVPCSEFERIWNEEHQRRDEQSTPEP